MLPVILQIDTTYTSSPQQFIDCISIKSESVDITDKTESTNAESSTNIISKSTTKVTMNITIPNEDNQTPEAKTTSQQVTCSMLRTNLLLYAIRKTTLAITIHDLQTLKESN